MGQNIRPHDPKSPAGPPAGGGGPPSMVDVTMGVSWQQTPSDPLTVDVAVTLSHQGTGINLRYQWGDGTSQTIPSAAGGASHTYPQPGQFIVTVSQASPPVPGYNLTESKTVTVTAGL